MRSTVLHLIGLFLVSIPCEARAASFSVLRSPYVPFAFYPALSGNGRVAVGFAVPGDWIWTADNPASPLPLSTYHNFPLPTGHLGYNVRHASNDGTILAGSLTEGRAFRFTVSDGLETIAPPYYQGLRVDISDVTDMTSDGSTIVGRAGIYSGLTQASFLRYEVFRWTRDSGVELLSSLPGAQVRVSDDGKVIVGTQGGASPKPFRWSAESGLEYLTLPAFLATGIARDISGDGSVIVGDGATGDPSGPYSLGFRWTRDTGFESLGTFVHPDDPGGSTSASLTSDDGSVVVGSNGAFVTYWTRTHGYRRLEDVAQEAGIDLGGFHPEDATGISADGLVITGHLSRAFFGTAYILDLRPVPEPTTFALSLTALALLHRAATADRAPRAATSRRTPGSNGSKATR